MNTFRLPPLPCGAKTSSMASLLIGIFTYMTVIGHRRHQFAQPECLSFVDGKM